MSTNAAVSAQGSTLGVATDAQLPTYTNVAQVTDYTDSTGTATKLDASNLTSTDKTYIAGLRDHGAVTIKGGTITIQATSQLKLSAPTISISADESLTLKSSATATLTGGASLQVKASGQVGITGGVVQVNG